MKRSTLLAIMMALVLLGPVACGGPLAPHCSDGWFGTGKTHLCGPGPTDTYWLDSWRIEIIPDTLVIPVGRGGELEAQVVQSHSGIPINQHRYTWTWKIADRDLCEGTQQGSKTVPRFLLVCDAPGVTRVTVKNKFATAHSTVIVQ